MNATTQAEGLAKARAAIGLLHARGPDTITLDGEVRPSLVGVVADAVQKALATPPAPPKPASGAAATPELKGEALLAELYSAIAVVQKLKAARAAGRTRAT